MKPGDDAHLVETLVSSETLLQGNFLCVKRDQVRLPDGRIAGREYVQHPGAVAIVPLLDDGRVVMVRQYRHPLARLLLEFPAGKLDGNESSLDCARRELTEETGYRAAEWAYAGFIHNAAAYSTEKIYLWFARGLVAGVQQLDQGEFLDVEVHDEATLDALASRGELTDIKTLFGLQWLQRWRAGAWALQWHAP